MERGLKYCLLCNPDGNGLKGKRGTKAIGKYFLPKAPDQFLSGWIPICDYCCDSIAPYYEIIPLPGKDKHQYFMLHSGKYNHKWHKLNLVTENDLHDTWQCEKCKVEIRTKIGGPKSPGCHDT